MRHFMIGGCILVSLAESFQEKARERGVSVKHERAVHVIVIRDFVNDMIGPGASGSSLHIREGKNDFFLLSGKFVIARFEIKLQLAKESFCLFNIFSIRVWDLRFELVIFIDRRSRMR